MARLFFAVEISPAIAAALRSLQKKLEKSHAAEVLKFTEPDQAHYTLKFLGPEPPERQIAAVRAGWAALAGARPFEMSLQTLGVFPDDRRPHTLWVGAGPGAAQLVELAASLEANLVREGFAAEHRPFVPHLTIARVKGPPPPGSIRQLLENRLEALGSLEVESFSLMESRPTPRGARYVRLEAFRF